jgi:5-hydroxyisourate hydrolase-like protein (transthyretin family)
MLESLMAGLAVLATVGQADAADQSPQTAGRSATPAKPVPVTGACLDSEGQPLTGVKVRLYREDYKARKHEKLGERQTGVDGRFEFQDAPALGDTYRLAVVVTKAGRGSIIQPLFPALLAKPLEFRMRPAGTLEGRVTDEAGKPVAGARIWARALLTGPVDSVSSAVTDADGKYAITDMGRSTDEDARPKPIGNGVMMVPGGCYFDVRHPNFAHERPMRTRIPTTVNVVLRPGGVIEGQVIDRVAGKPAAGVLVSLQGVRGMPTWDQVQTSADGTFTIRCLKAGQYNLWADAADRACAAIDSLTVTAGKTLTG